MEKKLYDLSNPQKSIWYTEQFHYGTNINNICGTAIISNSLNFDILKKAIASVILNNDSFKLRFKKDNNSLKQYIEELSNIDIEIVSLKNKDEVSILENQVLNRIFKITEEPLFEFKIFKFKDNSGGFLLNIHHLLADAWTLGLVCRKIMHIYSILITNPDEKIIEEPSYINYLENEQNYISSSRYEKDKLYWEKLFQTIPNMVTLPSNTSKNSDFSCKGNRDLFVIPKKQMSPINMFCKTHKISTFNFFMAILSIYLYKITSTDDFVIGTPILNRSSFDEKNTTGMFVNVAPLRINVGKHQSFMEFIESISKDSMGLLRHQKYPYQNILNFVREKDHSIPNLYNILLSYQITRANNESNFKYDTRWAFNGNSANDLDIQLYDLDEDGILNIAYDYKSDKYTNEDIKNLHNRLMILIEQVLDNTNISINNLEIVTLEEKNKILYEFNNTKSYYNENKTISQLFEEQAEKTPDNIAIVFENQQLTFKELNEKSNSLAYFLKNKGVTKNTLVGIMVNRSLEVIIAMLATLKAGGAYIPIDPTYPQDRIKYMLESSNAQILLTKKHLENTINFNNKVCINLNNNEIYSLPNNNLDNINNPEDLAYVIFTSGSTGLPKGVMLKHKSLSNLTNYCNNYVEYLKNPLYRAVVSITTVSFDIFIFETLISLQKGLKLIIANEQEQTDSNSLNQLIETHNVKIIQSTPSRMQLFVNNIQNIPSIKNLEFITLAGEQLPLNLVNSLHNISNAVIYNGYGPSETTVFSTLTKIDNNYISIGKPLDNTQIYILDKNLKLVPLGIAGELYISGDGVGKGY